MSDNIRSSPINGLTGITDGARPSSGSLVDMPSADRPASTPLPRPESKPSASPEVFRNVRLHFKVDPQTHDVTVLMVDMATRRVIRSIPPEELRQLDEGELVELLA